MENTTTDIRALNELIAQESAFIDLLNMELSKSIVGQKSMTEKLILALLAQGHVLLEGVPGLAKTLMLILFLKRWDSILNESSLPPI